MGNTEKADRLAICNDMEKVFHRKIRNSSLSLHFGGFFSLFMPITELWMLTCHDTVMCKNLQVVIKATRMSRWMFFDRITYILTVSYTPRRFLCLHKLAVCFQCYSWSRLRVAYSLIIHHLHLLKQMWSIGESSCSWNLGCNAFNSLAKLSGGRRRRKRKRKTHIKDWWPFTNAQLLTHRWISLHMSRHGW